MFKSPVHLFYRLPYGMMFHRMKYFRKIID